MDTNISIVAILDKIHLLLGDTAEISFRPMRGGMLIKINYLVCGEIRDVRRAITNEEIETFNNGNLITHCINLMLRSLSGHADYQIRQKLREVE